MVQKIKSSIVVLAICNGLFASKCKVEEIPTGSNDVPLLVMSESAVEEVDRVEKEDKKQTEVFSIRQVTVDKKGDIIFRETKKVDESYEINLSKEGLLEEFEFVVVDLLKEQMTPEYGTGAFIGKNEKRLTPEQLIELNEVNSLLQHQILVGTHYAAICGGLWFVVRTLKNLADS